MNLVGVLKRKSTIVSIAIGGLIGTTTAISLIKWKRNNNAEGQYELPVKIAHQSATSQTEEKGMAKTMLLNNDDTLSRGGKSYEFK